MNNDEKKSLAYCIGMLGASAIVAIGIVEVTKGTPSVAKKTNNTPSVAKIAPTPTISPYLVDTTAPVLGLINYTDDSTQSITFSHAVTMSLTVDCYGNNNETDVTIDKMTTSYYGAFANSWEINAGTHYIYVFNRCEGHIVIG